MDPNQLKKIVVPAAVVAGIILAVGSLFLLNEPGSGKSESNKPSSTPPASFADAAAAEGMTEKLPPTDSPDYKDIGEGLKILDVKVGEGPECKEGAFVTIHYTGWLLDGTVFDSSLKKGQPYSSPLRNLVKGWQKGVPEMKPGGIRRLVIPAPLAYGVEGRPGIPPNATLVFEIKLISSR